MACLCPRLMRIDALVSDAPWLVGDPSQLPDRLMLSASAVDEECAYLLEDGDDGVLYIGRSVQEDEAQGLLMAVEPVR